MRFKPTVSILFFIALSWLSAPTASAGLPITVGTMTLVSVSGISRMDFPVDPAGGTALKPILYAGATNATGCPNSGGLCDSCALSSPGGNLFPCNRTSVYPALRLHFEMTTTTTAVYSSSDIHFKNDAGIDIPLASQIYTPSTKTLSFEAAWSDICPKLSGANGTCSAGSGSITVSVGLGGSGTTITDKFDLQLIYSFMDATDPALLYTEDCGASGTITAPPTGNNFGQCYYKATRGDGKVYIDPMIGAATYPTFQGSVKYGGIAVFYAENTSGSDDTTLQNIKTNTAQRADFDLLTDATSITENRVTGLSNGSRYCFVMANKDVTGNVFYYAPIVGSSPPGGTTIVSDTICAQPDVVVGLLDDKSCFIATAAFGSDMAPEVQTFREFRNQFLLKSAWGRTFVKTYYKWSPPLANFISEHDTLRTGARALLWPLLFFAKLSLEWGIFWTALAAAMFTMLLIETVRRLRGLKTQEKAS